MYDITILVDIKTMATWIQAGLALTPV